MAEYSNIYICKVESVRDDNDGLRIKARIPYFDNYIDTDKLPYAFPLLPKFLNVNPKVGESVLVFTQVANKPSTDRFFIGPIISQPYMMSWDPHETSARKLLNGAWETKPYQKVNMDTGNEGTLPNREDIAIEGRNNTEVVLKDNEIRLRCGYKYNPTSNVVEDRLHRNDVNPAYIQMKYGINPMSDVFAENSSNYFFEANHRYKEGTINIVADRINLLTHDSSDGFNLHDKNDLISDDELRNIYQKAHQMVYGDRLVKYLEQLVNIFRNHRHQFAYKPPEIPQDQNDFFKINLDDEILSKNILIS